MPPPRSTRRRRLLAGLAPVACALVLCPAGARADGDPASDVLVTAPPLFLSATSGATYAQQATIAAQLRRAGRAGHRLRVAVISHRADLGSVTLLWRRPQRYADFLSTELSLQYRGELLVVMPDGFGVARGGTAVPTALAHLAPRGGELITATEQAVQRLTGTAAGRVRVVAAAAPSRTSGPGWWVATLLAAAVVAGAWTASLRARPPRLRRAPHEWASRRQRSRETH